MAVDTTWATLFKGWGVTMKKMSFQESVRPITRLFMLSSIDGKISTGSRASFDFDRDIPELLNTSGIQQYYDLEKETDSWTLCSGKTLEKISSEIIRWNKEPLPVTLVVCVNNGLCYDTYLALCNKYARVILATSNLDIDCTDAEILYYEYHNLVQLLQQLRGMGCTHLTIQSGGTLNAAFLRAGLIDTIEYVVAPIAVGGRDTPSMFDGDTVRTLKQIAPLHLDEVRALKESYVYLRYRVEKP